MNPALTQVICDRLRLLRHERGWNQAKVAASVYTSQQFYSRLETGRSPLSSDIIIRLASLYSVSADYILGLTDQREPAFRGSILKCPRAETAFADEVTYSDFCIRTERMQEQDRRRLADFARYLWYSEQMSQGARKEARRTESPKTGRDTEENPPENDPGKAT
jgi:transcriptional regulator with XRE-family HTH domain